MTYDDEVLQEINKNIDLISYAMQSMQLEKKGDNYFAHCPLHTDITPSLCFSPERNMYHCFSCGKSGRAIGYLIDFEGLEFEEAVDKAAILAQIDLSKICKSDTMTFLKNWNAYLSSINTERPEHPILLASEYEKYSKESIEEWIKEGITQEAIDYFDVRVDHDGNRIVYPVYDINGNLINIKGRTRYENYKRLRLAKYMNYKKVGVMDYFQCLDKTLPYVQAANEIVIFEGIKSVMKMYGWNHKNCASSEKHTLTREQIELLVKLRVDVVLAYDSDVSYKEKDVKQNIDILKRITNVYIIEDPLHLLGGAESKNSPVDCGIETWEELYSKKRKVVR